MLLWEYCNLRFCTSQLLISAAGCSGKRRLTWSRECMEQVSLDIVSLCSLDEDWLTSYVHRSGHFAEHHGLNDRSNTGSMVITIRFWRLLSGLCLNVQYERSAQCYGLPKPSTWKRRYQISKLVMLGARFAFHWHDRVLPKLIARNKRNGKVSECIKGCDLLAAKLFWVRAAFLLIDIRHLMLPQSQTDRWQNHRLVALPKSSGDMIDDWRVDKDSVHTVGQSRAP
jgi:hypothetical protein